MKLRRNRMRNEKLPKRFFKVQYLTR